MFLRMTRRSNASMPCLIFKLVFLNLFCNLLASSSYSNEDGRKIYIVYMGSKPEDTTFAHLQHRAMLEEVVGSIFAPQSVIYTYHRSFNGFAVKLTEQEAQKIADKEGVVSVFPSKKSELDTTNSWDFLNFPQNVPRVPQVESNIIVGVFDSGITPNSASFSDVGFGPPPAKWKGICQTSTNFRCNRKIIGARVYRSNTTIVPGDVLTPVDTSGHGTHVASILGGDVVQQASLEGLGVGMARGGVPSARIAVYKVCWSDGCNSIDLLKAFDDAIADGVDVISYSIAASQDPYFQDVFAIGSFHAMKSGVLTSKSAGNDGPSYSTLTGLVPWCVAVAATTTDRNFVTDVRLGNGNTYKGYTINTIDLLGRQYPLVYGGDVPNTAQGFNSYNSSRCVEGSVDVNMVRGKILVCDEFHFPGRFGYLINITVGILMQDSGVKYNGQSYPMAASHLSSDDGLIIKQYMNSTKNPTATIFKSNTVFNYTARPVAAYFSSRGPNTVNMDILKPDLAAPGVQILAAWPPTVPVSSVGGDPRRTLYNIISGTSMACPHVSAAAMYVKTFHPTWSPSAIKSALMTTATPMSSNLQLELAYGSGLLNPLKAKDPGLVYDANEVDYVRFLCGQGYNTTMLQTITGDKSSVCTPGNSITVFDLNYPSFTFSMDPSNLNVNQNFRRTLTNVAPGASTYTATFSSQLPGLTITVNPSTLSFNAIGVTKSFTLTIQGRASLNRIQPIISTFLVWSDGSHQVRSPIVIFLKNIS